MSKDNNSVLHKLFKFVLKFNRSVIVGASLALFVIGYVTFIKLRTEMHKVVRNQLESSLISNAESLKQWLETQKSLVENLANQPEMKDLAEQVAKVYEKGGSEEVLKSSAFSEMRKRLRNYCQSTDFQEFYLINYDYQCIAAEQQKFVGYQLSQANSCFPALQNLSETIVQLPLKGSEDTGNAETISMFAATPIKDKTGNIVAIMALVLPPEKTFSRVMRASRVGESGETYAINEQGWMISESRFTEQLKKEGHLAQEKNTSVLHIRAEQPEGGLTAMASSALGGEKDVSYPFVTSNIKGYLDYRGVAVVGAWTYLDEYGFALTSEMDYEEAMSPVAVIRSANIIVVGLATTFLIMLMIYSRMNIEIEEELQEAVSNAKEMGQYRVLGKIGEGGMGVIYKAEHKLMKRETAVKLLKSEACSEEVINRFEKEVMLSSKLTHPNTISIYDFGKTEEGVFYYVMELLDGLDIDEFVEKCGPLTPQRTIYLLLQACASLNEAHLKNLIHRDIKPQNIMVCHSGAEFDVVKVLDFGLVKELTAEATMTMSISGSPKYMSPESITAPQDVTSSTDIYSLGITAFFMLTGRYPFNKGDSPTAALFQHINAEPKRPSEVVKFSIPEDLENLIMKCMEKDPRDRPASMNDLAKELMACQDAHGWDKHKAMEWWAENPGILQTTSEKLKPATREKFDSTLKIHIAQDS